VAAQARDAERRRLGLYDLAWLKEARGHQAEMMYGNARATTGGYARVQPATPSP